MHPTRSLVLLAALLGPLAGCGPGVPPVVDAGGMVTLDGKPLPHAEVQFVPLHPGLNGDYIASAVTDDAGRYTLALPAGRAGACACEHRVVVSEGPLPEDARGMSAASQVKAGRFLAALKNRPIPVRYTTAAQSTLSVTVAAGKTNYPLELTR